MKIITKWSAPLKFDFIWHLPKLKETLTKQIQSTFAHTTGKLAHSFRFRARHKDVEIKSHLPYAEAQEYGAHIPSISKNKGALRWKEAGTVVFSKYRRAFNLHAKPYVRPALEKWAKKIDAVWKGDKK